MSFALFQEEEASFALAYGKVNHEDLCCLSDLPIWIEKRPHEF